MKRKGFERQSRFGRRPKGGGADVAMERRLMFLKKARERTAQALRSRDVMLAQLSRSIEQLEEISNLLEEKLEEMYSLQFPELKTSDRKSYVGVALNMDMENPDPASISRFVGEERAKAICQKARESTGGQLEAKDIEKIRELAREIENIYGLIESYEAYLDEMAKEVCPNIEHLVGGKLAGKLVSLAGSLRKLSLMPASTIQVLGAEKALFKHLKNKQGVAPPKHGVLFQYPAISQSNRKVRGKIARALAAKLAIAAKADAQTKRFIAPMLKKNLEARIKEILSEKKARA